MPGGDRTGPISQGPMTGRGAGFCAGSDMPGFMSAGPGRGFSRGRGFGRGMGRGFGRGWGMGFGRGRGWCWAPPFLGEYGPLATGEPEAIKDEISALENQIEFLNRRLDELAEKKPDEE